MPDANKRRVPLGHAIVWSPGEIDRMCQVTPVDVRLARLWWRKHAPAKYRRLLEAKAGDGQRNPNE